MSFKKTMDRAIKVCDEEIKLVKTIASRNGYSVHIVEDGHGKKSCVNV